jgi:hypothetical protein
MCPFDTHAAAHSNNIIPNLNTTCKSSNKAAMNEPLMQIIKQGCDERTSAGVGISRKAFSNILYNLAGS